MAVTNWPCTRPDHQTVWVRRIRVFLWRPEDDAGLRLRNRRCTGRGCGCTTLTQHQPYRKQKVVLEIMKVEKARPWARVNFEIVEADAHQRQQTGNRFRFAASCFQY